MRPATAEPWCRPARRPLRRAAGQRWVTAVKVELLAARTGLRSGCGPHSWGSVPHARGAGGERTRFHTSTVAPSEHGPPAVSLCRQRLSRSEHGKGGATPRWAAPLTPPRAGGAARVALASKAPALSRTWVFGKDEPNGQDRKLRGEGSGGAAMWAAACLPWGGGAGRAAALGPGGGSWGQVADLRPGGGSRAGSGSRAAGLFPRECRTCPLAALTPALASGTPGPAGMSWIRALTQLARTREPLDALCRMKSPLATCGPTPDSEPLAGGCNLISKGKESICFFTKCFWWKRGGSLSTRLACSPGRQRPGPAVEREHPASV